MITREEFKLLLEMLSEYELRAKYNSTRDYKIYTALDKAICIIRQKFECEVCEYSLGCIETCKIKYSECYHNKVMNRE